MALGRAVARSFGRRQQEEKFQPTFFDGVAGAVDSGIPLSIADSVTGVGRGGGGRSGFHPSCNSHCIDVVRRYRAFTIRWSIALPDWAAPRAHVAVASLPRLLLTDGIAKRSG